MTTQQEVPSDQVVSEQEEFDLEDPNLYLNRELTWLAFNSRVLSEASREKNPILERVKFL
ncbi:MAG: hypothetical protein ABW138_17590, partial [Candidatus Thiodiazotropha sp. 4PDIVS1]